MSVIDIPDSVLRMDSSKLQTAMECPRRFFYEHVLNWRREGENVHLGFGTAWHEGMEVLADYRMSPDAEPGYPADILIEAIGRFTDSYREHFPDVEGDPDRQPKTIENGQRAFVMYAQHYHLDSFKVHRSEIGGTVLVSPTRYMYFKIDAICEDENGVWILEHKTTGARGFTRQWNLQWKLRPQLGTYIHALYCLYDFDTVFGAIINGVKMTNPPRMKRDGTPYANSSDIEFTRLPLTKQMGQLDTWRATVNFWYDIIEQQLEKLQQETADQPTMESFPMNPTACMNYGGCPFHDFCCAWPNPLKRCQVVQPGFVQDVWDPKVETSKVREVVELR